MDEIRWSFERYTVEFTLFVGNQSSYLCNKVHLYPQIWLSMNVQQTTSIKSYRIVRRNLTLCVYLSNGLFFFERCSLITATVCAYKLNNAR